MKKERKKKKVVNGEYFTSAKENLSLEEIFYFSIVVFCVGSESATSTSGLGPVDFCHTPHKHT